MASEGAVGVVLVLEDPLAGDDIGTRRARDKPPGAVVDERPVLVNHRSAPIGVGEGVAIVWPGVVRRVAESVRRSGGGVREPV